MRLPGRSTRSKSASRTTRQVIRSPSTTSGTRPTDLDPTWVRTSAACGVDVDGAFAEYVVRPAKR
jgi:hypothetical protein